MSGAKTAVPLNPVTQLPGYRAGFDQWHCAGAVTARVTPTPNILCMRVEYARGKVKKCSQPRQCYANYDMWRHASVQYGFGGWIAKTKESVCIFNDK